MKTRFFPALFLAVALAGCGTMPTDGGAANAQQAVFTAKSAYATTLTVAVAYKNLRPCGASVPQPCSDPAIVAQLQKADIVANTALDAAEAAVRTPQVGTTARDRAVATANSALAALSALLSNVR